MHDLSQHSLGEIQAELQRREEMANAPPTPLENPDFSKLIQVVTDGIATAAKEKYMDDDFREYIFEEVFKAIYGPNYWKWRNNQKW